MEKQIDKSHYYFQKYCYPDRWASYYHQINESLKLEPKNILEIGAGDKFFGNYIKSNTGIEYKNLDIANDLNPDTLGSVDDMPVADNSFDLVCAFEVLEHLPFEKFEKCLNELKRVSKKYIVISLPHFGPPVKFLIKLPFLPKISFAFKIPFARKHTFNGQHYWEIGKRGYSSRAIRGILKKYFVVEKEFVPFENQYHRFYILTKHTD